MNDRRGFPVLVLAALMLTSCNHQSASARRNDAQLAADVQAKLHAESALAGQNIQVAVEGGRITLSGSTADPASRALAGNDAGSIAGVRTVINNLSVATPAAPAQMPMESAHTAPAVQETQIRRPSSPPAELHRNQQPVRVAEIHPPTMPPPANQPPLGAPAPGPTPPPVPAPNPVRTVTVPSGTSISVRIDDNLSSATASPDMAFHATLAQDLVIGNMVAIPQGTPILGRVIDSRDAAHFKGASLLSIELTRIDIPNDHLAIVTDAFEKQGEARGKNTAEKVGGGALLGTLIGALAGGGKGAAIGAIAGAGAGGAVQGATRGQQVEIPSEALVNFSLQSPITVTTSRQVGSPPPANPPTETPALQTRPPQ